MIQALRSTEFHLASGFLTRYQAAGNCEFGQLSAKRLNRDREIMTTWIHFA